LTDTESWLRLLFIPGLGLARRARLIQAFPDATSIFQTSPLDIVRAVPSISPSLARQILNYNCYAEVHRQLQFIRKNSISIITFSQEGYPPLLKTIAFPPILLFYKGMLPDTADSLAVIGSRKPLSYSLDACRNFVRQIAGHTNKPIVSGLALGIDAAAHKEALSCDLPCIGVLAFGFNTFYPAVHQALARQILDQNGVLLSEYPAYTRLTRNNFLERNRIIAGLSKGTLIIQAALRSGSMKTAFMAMDYNRDLFVVPYRYDSPWYEGSHKLLRQGAVFCCSARDILREWDITWEETPQQKKVTLSGLEKKIYHSMTRGNNTVDTLLQTLDCDFMDISEALMNMEINGLIKKDVAGVYSILTPLS